MKHSTYVLLPVEIVDIFVYIYGIGFIEKIIFISLLFIFLISDLYKNTVITNFTTVK